MTATARPAPIGYAERAAFYEIDYPDSVELGRLRRLLSPAVHSVLEIPCGVGGITLRLLEPGRRWVAVDREPEMVRRLRERAAGHPGVGSLLAVVGDLRNLDLGEAFDLVVVQREAFQLLAREDAPAALRRLRAHLAPGAVLSIDLATFAPQEHGSPLQPSYYDPTLPDGATVDEWTRGLPSGEVLSRRRVQRHRSGAVEIEFLYDLRAGDGSREQWSATVAFTSYGKEEVIDLAAAAGLEPREIEGDYEGGPYCPGGRMLLSLVAAG
jgi:SAM-dependent methyltransferase